VVLDWDGKSCALLDSGFTYGTKYTGVNAQFTNDGKALVVFSHSQVFRWQHYEIAELQKHMLSADACFDTSILSLLPTHSRLYSVVPDILEDGFSLLHAWNPLTAQSWCDYAGLSPLSSFVYLLTADDPGDNFMNFGAKRYRIVQHYATEDGSLDNYFSKNLQNCATLQVTGDVFPIMTVSFDHVCWLSDIVDIRNGDWNFRRELLMASFPPPRERQCKLRSRVRKVEIPDAILENAAQIFLVPSEGSIMVLTTGRKLHTFRYA